MSNANAAGWTVDASPWVDNGTMESEVFQGVTIDVTEEGEITLTRTGEPRALLDGDGLSENRTASTVHAVARFRMQGFPTFYDDGEVHLNATDDDGVEYLLIAARDS